MNKKVKQAEGKENVKTKLGQKFLLLIDRCIPADHRLARVVNRNSVKVPNLKNLVSIHNKKIQKHKETPGLDPACNCRTSGEPCPMHNAYGKVHLFISYLSLG